MSISREPQHDQKTRADGWQGEAVSTSALKSWPKKLGYPKTCPMSRHAAMIANDLRSRSKGGYGLLLREAGYDVDHMGETLEATVVALWEARVHMEWQSLPPTKKHKYNGHWVPLSPTPAPKP